MLVGSYDLILFEKGHYVGANAGCSFGMASPITIGIIIICFVWHPWVDGNREVPSALRTMGIPSITIAH